MASRRARTSLKLTIPGIIWLFAAAGLATIGLVKNINLILLVTYFLVALVLWNLYVARKSVRRINIKRLPQNPAFAGEEVPCEYEVINRSKRAISNVILNDSPLGLPQSWPIPALPAKNTIQMTRLVPATQRGRFVLQPLFASCLAPFGLARGRADGENLSAVWIYPARGVIDLDRLRLLLPALGVGHERRRSLVPFPAEETDIHGLRPFRTGDSPRLIHWKTTARVGEPMVREFDRNAASDLLVTWDMAWVAADLSNCRLEAALEFLTTLVWNWSIKTDATLTVALPEAGGIHTYQVSRRADAHQLLRVITTFALPQEKSLSSFMYDPALDRVPVITIGETAISNRRGIALDPTNASDFYRPPVGNRNDE